MKAMTGFVPGMALQAVEKDAKSYIGKYAARRIYFAIPLLAILLTVSPIPAQAGVIDTVNNKVTTILKKVKTIASNTNGLQEFITTLRDMRDSMGGGMIDDMRETIGETQDLMQFIKDRRESAGQTSQYPSLHVLVESLDGASDVLLERNGQGGVLEGLSALLAVLPEKALAPVARAVTKVGIDSDFVAMVDLMATDLVEIREIIVQADTAQDSASQGAAIDWSVGVDALYDAQFGCHISKLQLVTLNRTTKRVKTGAQRLKLVGALTQAKDEGIKLKKGAGVWGWVSVSPEAKPQWVIGKVLEIIGDASLNLVGRAENHIGTCKDHFNKLAEA